MVSCFKFKLPPFGAGAHLLPHPARCCLLAVQSHEVDQAAAQLHPAQARMLRRSAGPAQEPC